MAIWVNTRGRTTLGIGECDRCHFKFPLGDLMPDGNAPGLRVCKGCCDEFDPYRLSARQPDDIVLPFYRPQEPLVVPDEVLTAPVLSASQAGANDPVVLVWTEAEPPYMGDPILGYRVYVQVNGGGYALLTTTTDLTYSDETAYSDDDELDYYVQAYSLELDRNSNIDSVTYQAVSFEWNLEAADVGAGVIGAFRDYTFQTDSYIGVFTGNAATMLGQAGPIRLNQINTDDTYFYLEVGRDSADAADCPKPFGGLSIADEGGTLLELLTATAQSGEEGVTGVDSDRYNMGGGTNTAYIQYRWERPVGSDFVFEIGKRYILTLIPMGDPEITAETSGPNTGYFNGVEGSIVNSILQGAQQMTITTAQDYSNATGFRFYLTGAVSQPGVSDFTSVTINGQTYLASAATFSGGGGNTRTWVWGGSPAGLVNGVVYPMTVVI